MTGPDGNVAIVDGEPEVVINAAAIAQLVRESPLGADAALERLRSMLPADAFVAVENHLRDSTKLVDGSQRGIDT
jgi:hypothetical protein